MNVYAVRDDGALLVTESGRPQDPAVIISGLNFFVTTQGAALARGEWSDPDGQVIPEPLREPVRSSLQQTAAEADQDAPMTMIENLTAAAEVHTGAMIALVPTEEDAARIAIDGGEDPDELHVTLAYLGEVAMLPPELRHALVECVADCVSRLPTIIGNIFAVNLFNPRVQSDTPSEITAALTAGGTDPCIVWGVGGELVDVVHKAVCYDVEGVFMRYGMTMHPQHRPWVAHITATYITENDDVDLTAFASAVGPVTFDRVRLAFGDEVYDIPLGEVGEEPEEEDNPTEADLAAAAGGPQWKDEARAPAGKSTGGQFVKSGDSGSSKDADYTDAIGMSQAEWNKLSDEQKAALLTAVWVAEGYNKPGAKAALGKLQGYIQSTKRGGGGGSGSSGKKKEPKPKKAPKPKRARASDAMKNDPRDGEVIAETASGDSRVRYAAESKQWVVETKRGREWRPQRYYNPDEARDLLSKSSDWYDPENARAVRAGGGQANDDESLSPKERELIQLLEKTRRERHQPRKAAEVDNTIAMTMNSDGVLVADVAFDENGEPIVPNVLFDWRAWLEHDDVHAFARERDVNLPAGPGHNLRDYWTRGPGAAKIRWGEKNDFYRCVSHLGKYVKNPQGLCNEYHQRATGSPPGQGPHVGD